jgi:hypothetical protein
MLDIQPVDGEVSSLSMGPQPTSHSDVWGAGNEVDAPQ